MYSEHAAISSDQGRKDFQQGCLILASLQQTPASRDACAATEGTENCNEGATLPLRVHDLTSLQQPPASAQPCPATEGEPTYGAGASTSSEGAQPREPAATSINLEGTKPQ